MNAPLNVEVLKEIAERVAKAVVTELARTPRIDGLWDVEDIARHIKRTERYVRTEVICDPTFPKPVRLGKPKGRGKRAGHPLYYPQEVLAWVRSNQQQ